MENIRWAQVIFLAGSRRQVGPEVGPTTAFYNCIHTETYGPTGIFRGKPDNFLAAGLDAGVARRAGREHARQPDGGLAEAVGAVELRGRDGARRALECLRDRRGVPSLSARTRGCAAALARARAEYC